MALYDSHKSLFLIPSWVWSVMQRYGLKTHEVLDIRKMKQYLSVEDIVSVFQINQECSYFLSSNASSVPFNWFGPVAEDEFNHFLDLAQSTMTEFHTRIIEGDKQGDKPYEIRDISTDQDMVIIYPGHFSDKNLETNRFNLIRDLLALSFNRFGFTSVTEKYYFNTYLQKLAV